MQSAVLFLLRSNIEMTSFQPITKSVEPFLAAVNDYNQVAMGFLQDAQTWSMRTGRRGLRTVIQLKSSKELASLCFRATYEMSA